MHLENMNIKQKSEAEESARKYLLQWVKPGMRIYTALKNVSSSGMSRRISVYIPYKKANKELAIMDITHDVAMVCGFRWNSDKGELVVGGCGMDMGYHVVYSLSRTLFKGKFHCLGEGCPSNDHVNGDRDYTKHKHSDGGYALTHSWI